MTFRPGNGTYLLVCAIPERCPYRLVDAVAPEDRARNVVKLQGHRGRSVPQGACLFLVHFVVEGHRDVQRVSAVDAHPSDVPTNRENDRLFRP